MRSEQRIISVFIVLQTAQYILVSGNLCSSLFFINCQVKDSLTTYQDLAAHRAHVQHIFCRSQSFSNVRWTQKATGADDRFLTRSPHGLFSWLLQIAGQGIYLRVKRKPEWKICKICQLKCNFQTTAIYASPQLLLWCYIAPSWKTWIVRKARFIKIRRTKWGGIIEPSIKIIFLSVLGQWGGISINIAGH